MGLTPWDNLTTGVVMAGGELNSPLMDNIRNGTYTALLYKDSAVRTETNVTVTNGVAASLAPRYVGFAFVLGEPLGQRRRTYRVTEVTLDEEGEVILGDAGCDGGHPPVEPLLGQGKSGATPVLSNEEAAILSRKGDR